MMVEVHEWDAELTELIARMEAGEEIVIARNGVPVAKLVPYERQIRLGAARGEMWLSEDWDSDEANAEIAALFDPD